MRVLVYDGDCTLCVGISRRLVAWSGVEEARRRAHDAFDAETFTRLAEAGIHDELAVLEEASGEIRSGIAGILWWLREGRLAGLARAFDHPVGRALLRPLYRLIAYNRRVIAPTPVRAIPCACDPGPHPGYHAALVAILAATAGGGAFLLVRAMTSSRGIAALALLPVGGAVLSGLAAPPGKRSLQAASRLWPLAMGGFVAGVGGMLAGWLPGLGARLALLGGAVGGIAVCVRSLLRRRRARAGGGG